jgi:glutathione S-transferase
MPDLKLRYSATSPYARKVRVVAHELGLKLELIATDTWNIPAALVAENPLGKVPSLLIDGTWTLYDSPVICEYLIEVGEGWCLLAKTGVARFEILKQQAFGDGLMDGAVEIFAERNFRPEAKQSLDWIERQSAKISTALDHFEQSLSRSEAAFSLGTIAIGSALTYLDLRLPELAWRKGRPG